MEKYSLKRPLITGGDDNNDGFIRFALVNLLIRRLAIRTIATNTKMRFSKVLKHAKSLEIAFVFQKLRSRILDNFRHLVCQHNIMKIVEEI